MSNVERVEPRKLNEILSVHYIIQGNSVYPAIIFMYAADNAIHLLLRNISRVFILLLAHNVPLFVDSQSSQFDDNSALYTLTGSHYPMIY